MKKLFAFALFAGACFIVYKVAFASSAAYQAYEEFADAMLYDRWDDARKLAGSDKVERIIDDAEALPRRMGETYRTLRGVVHMGPSRTVVSEKASPDGNKVTLRVVQEERRGPTTMSPIGKPTVRHRQMAVMALQKGGWKVEEFEDDVEPLNDR